MSTGTKFVLVVEDDPDMREAFAELLALEGHRASLAGSAEEGLAALSREVPDLILLDMVMPKMTGEEFLVRLRNEPRWAEIPVVATTALLLRSRPKHTVALLTKPFQTTELSAVIMRYSR